MSFRALNLLWVAAAIALLGCASGPSSQVDILPITAKVSNQSGKTVSSITYQPCGADAATWSPVNLAPIAAGGTATFQISHACVNLRAFYPDGRLAGTQTGVRRDFPFSWVIE